MAQVPECKNFFSKVGNRVPQRHDVFASIDTQLPTYYNYVALGPLKLASWIRLPERGRTLPPILFILIFIFLVTLP